MKWLKINRFCGQIIIWALNNRIFFFYQPFHWGYEFELRFYITKRHEIAFYGYADFNWKHPFSAAFKFKRTRAKLSIALFGWEVSFRIGEVVCDEYDAHRDIYFPYGELVGETEWKAYQDEKMTIPENYVKPQPKRFKSFYHSKWLKIYNEDYLNNPCGRVIKISLPFHYNIRLYFEKPFEYWEWFGLKIASDLSKGFDLLGKLTLFKFDFTARLSKKGGKND